MLHTAYLATITSEEENMWVLNTFGPSNYWIGGADTSAPGKIISVLSALLNLFFWHC